MAKKLFVKKADMTEEEIKAAEEKKENMVKIARKAGTYVLGGLAFVGGAVLVLFALGAATVSTGESSDSSETSDTIEAEGTNEEVTTEPAV